jgi:low affinity Fe/Cu permease
MKKKNKGSLSRIFDKFTTKATKLTGSPWAFILACLAIIIWSLTGPLFGFSDTWQLIINTSTTIITFLMVFIIQQTQNKDTIAIHLKLNELIASNTKASNRLVDAEDLTEEELQVLKRFYVKLSAMAKDDNDIHASHTIEEAEDLQKEKSKVRGINKKKPSSTAKN